MIELFTPKTVNSIMFSVFESQQFSHILEKVSTNNDNA
jgi:hypothetical protein